MKASANLLGLLQQTKSERAAAALDESAVDPRCRSRASSPSARALAREKNWSESDRLRDALADMGVVLKDCKDGTTWEIKR